MLFRLLFVLLAGGATVMRCVVIGVQWIVRHEQTERGPFDLFSWAQGFGWGVWVGGLTTVAVLLGMALYVLPHLFWVKLAASLKGP